MDSTYHTRVDDGLPVMSRNDYFVFSQLLGQLLEIFCDTLESVVLDREGGSILYAEDRFWSAIFLCREALKAISNLYQEISNR